jgi:phage baseplate assembly protein gpV
MSDLVRELMADILELRRELADVRLTMARMVQTGTVEELDGQNGYRVKLGEDENGKPILSPWYPHPEAGGVALTWVPLTKGEIVTAINPGGDPQKGFLIRGGFSDQFQQPSQSLDETVFDFHKGKRREVTDKNGNHTVTLAGDETRTIKGGQTLNVQGQIVFSAGGGHLA